MPPPRRIPPLPVICMLPRTHRILAETALRQPRASSDLILLLADGFDEFVREVGAGDPARNRAIRTLITELRRRAPEYA